MSLLLKYNTFYLLAEITLKLGDFNRLKNTSHILLMHFLFFYYVRRSVLFKKFMLLILKLRSFLFLFLSVTMENYS